MKKITRLFAALAIAGMVLAFPAITNTEQEAQANCTYHMLRVASPQGPCQNGGQIVCFQITYEWCETEVVCHCIA